MNWNVATQADAKRRTRRFASASSWKYVGVRACAQCHSAPQEINKVPADRPQTDFVHLTEYVTWRDLDKHSQAYASLKNERSVHMGKLLGVDVTATAVGCINCHAMNFPEAKRGDLFEIADGVSCDGCHGPASDWLVPHYTKKDWRTLPAAEKEKLGFLDVRNPVVRAKMCVSCHVGNAAEGKIVTHEMYAVGHPPLPSIEVQTFADNLPKHWRNPGEKPAWVREQLGHTGDDLYVTKSLLIGGAVSLRQSLELLSATAAKRDGTGAWPELTQFDCYACHHDLRSKSWRQERGYTATPGRPQFRTWPASLAKLSLTSLGRSGADLDAALKPVQLAGSSQPFGKPDEITTQSTTAVKWLDADVLSPLRDKKIDRTAAERLLVSLCELSAESAPDYDSARQIAWAFNAIYKELHPDAATHDPRITQALKHLDRDLRLTLPSRKNNETIETTLADTLRTVADYDPTMVRQQFQQIKTALTNR